MARMMMIIRLTITVFISAGLVLSAEKIASSTEKVTASESRNGEIVDQIAEESRIAEVVEAQEKSYANSGSPPIPIPIPVQVRPGALVLPSPGRNPGGNKPNSDYGLQGLASSYAKLQDSASAHAATFQSQALPAQDSQNQKVPPQQPPPPPPQSQGPQSKPHPHNLPPPPPPHHPKQPFHQGQLPNKNPGQMLPPPPLPGAPQVLPNQAQHRPQNGPPSAVILPPPPPPHGMPLPNLPPHQPRPPHSQSHRMHTSGGEIQVQQTHPSANFEVGVVPVGASFQGFPNAADELWPQTNLDLPQILHVEAKCEKDKMKVAIKFDKPFFGVVFSKGSYDNEKCIYMRPGQGQTSSTFDIAINGCGTKGNTQNGLYGFGEQSGSGSFFENTIIVQYDPLVQEVWDQARKLRCSWHDYYERPVTFKPFNVEMLKIAHTDFAGDNVGCWMQIQVGIGPWANEVTGIVKIGQTMTMVLAIKDADNKFDMLVKDCVAHDGKREPILLVDDNGCIVRPKLMSKFRKIRNPETSASVMSYAHFQAFKFPDSMDVHFQCNIQICRHQCPEQCAQPVERVETRLSESLKQPVPFVQGGRPRLERSVFGRLKRSGTLKEGVGEAVPLMTMMTTTKRDAKSIGVDGNIKVVSTGDLAFNLNGMSSNDTMATMVYPMSSDKSGLICIATSSFTITVIFLLAILVVSCIVSAFLCLRHRAISSSNGSPGSSMDNIYKAKPTFYHFLRTGRY